MSTTGFRGPFNHFENESESTDTFMHLADFRMRTTLIEVLGGGRGGLRFTVYRCFWNGLTVFGLNSDDLTVPLFPNGFQISSQVVSSFTF